MLHLKAMNPEVVLAVLPDNKEEAKSLKEIALAMGLDISSYTAMARTKRQLSRTLRSLVKWGWVNMISGKARTAIKPGIMLTGK